MWFLVGWGHRCESQLNRTGPFNVEDQCVKPIGTQAFPFLLPELPNALYSTLKNAIRMSCGVARLEAPVLTNDDVEKTDFPFFDVRKAEVLVFCCPKIGIIVFCCPEQGNFCSTIPVGQHRTPPNRIGFLCAREYLLDRACQVRE